MRDTSLGIVRLLFVCVVALIHAAGGNGQTDGQHGSQSEYQPLVMLTEHNPWAMVIGSDSPTFVLYTNDTNGVVIYLKEGTCRTTRLDREDVGTFVRQLDLEALDGLKGSYAISRVTDRPTNVLLFRVGAKEKKISVYGSIDSLRSQHPAELPIPDKLSNALRQVMNYDSANSWVWKPDYVEVMVWPFDYAKGKTASWPKKWPGISDPTTVKRREVCSIFIPEAQSEELATFLKQLKPTQAVLIDNRKWAISTRLPFPHEMK